MRDQGISNSVLDLMGNTPLARLSRLHGADKARLLAKLECFNPGGSRRPVGILTLSDVVHYHLKT